MKRIVDENTQQRMNITGQAIRRARQRLKLTQNEWAVRLETLAVYICAVSFRALRMAHAS